VLVAPDAEILGTDAPLGKNGGCLSQDQSGSTYRATPEMNEMPVVRESVAARILTHRRDEHPIGKRQISNRERIKQARHSQNQWSHTSRYSSLACRAVALCEGGNATYEQSSNSSRGYTIENADQPLHDLRSILNQRECVWCHQIHYPNSGEITHRAL